MAVKSHIYSFLYSIPIVLHVPLSHSIAYINIHGHSIAIALKYIIALYEDPKSHH